MIGKLIVFEGIDGAGKDTLINSVLAKINNVSENKLSIPAWLIKPIFFTFEPTKNSLWALKIKEHLNNNNLKDNDLLLKWFIADRVEHTKKIKKKLLHSNVFCARYDLSTYAYQASEADNFKDFEAIYKKHQYSSFTNPRHGSLIPDITIFLKLDILLALERIEERDGEKEYYEKKEKLAKIQRRYLEAITFLQAKDERKIFIIEANQPVANIVELILEIFRQKI